MKHRKQGFLHHCAQATLLFSITFIIGGPAMAQLAEPLDSSEPQQEPQQTENLKPDKKKKQKSQQDSQSQAETLRIRGRLMAGWELSGDGSLADALYLRRARLDARWTPLDWVKLVLEVELRNLTNGPRPRDLYAEFNTFNWFDVTVGYFKKPFSRLRMMSPWDLLIPERGLLDQNVVGNGKYGGFGARDLGLMVSGDLKGPAILANDPLKFSYYAGLFNSVPGETDYHRDLVARAQVRLFKGLVLAANTSLKFYEAAGAIQSASMWGADLKWELGNFTTVLEAATGTNIELNGQLWGAHSTFSYAIPLWDTLVLTPALMFEVYDPEVQGNEDLDLRLAAAINLDLNENVRFVLSADKVWTDIQASSNTLPDPLTIRLQTNLRF